MRRCRALDRAGRSSAAGSSARSSSRGSASGPRRWPDGRRPIAARRRLRPRPWCPTARASRWPGGAAVRPGPARRGSRRAAARSGQARPGRAASRPPSRSRCARRRPPRTVAGRSVPVARTGPWPERGRDRPRRRAADRARRSPASAARAGGVRRVAAARRRRPRPRRDPTSARRAAGSPPTRRPSPPRRWPPARRRPAGSTRPSRAIDGSTASRACPMAAACQLHGGRERGPGQRVDRQEAGRLAAEDPGRRVVGGGEAIQGRAHGWLAEDEPDARGRRRPAVGGRIVAQEQQPARAGEPEDRGRGPLPEAPEVLAQPRLDRARRSRSRAAG